MGTIISRIVSNITPAQVEIPEDGRAEAETSLKAACGINLVQDHINKLKDLIFLSQNDSAD